MLAAMEEGADLSSLRAAVSAGETLPAPIYEAWRRRTGLPMLDGIGATEMLHIFITNRLEDSRPACTGKPVSGYEARVVDEDMAEAARGNARACSPCAGRSAAATSTIRGSADYVKGRLEPHRRHLRAGTRRDTSTSSRAATT